MAKPAKKKNILHFRVDDSLSEALDALIDPDKGLHNRSQVARMLLAGAIGNDVLVSAVQEQTIIVSAARTRIVKRASAYINDGITQILHEEVERLRSGEPEDASV
jgi:uncharacterized protein YerC